jgi:methionyl-tRNA synthetase
LGIDVPVEGEGKKLYVWFDAPIGYISATKEWALREGKENRTGRSRHKLVHFIGKDNMFSLHYFPAMLKAEGSYILQCACK